MSGARTDVHARRCEDRGEADAHLRLLSLGDQQDRREGEPWNVCLERRGQREADVLWNILHTQMGALGNWNVGRYSNPAADVLMDKARGTINANARRAIEAQIMDMVMDDAAVIPLHDRAVVAATKNTRVFTTMANEQALAENVKPKAAK